MNFQLSREGDGTQLVTETRVRASNAASRRTFRLYWLLIRPWSGLIRRAWLRAIARRAEPVARRPNDHASITSRTAQP